MKFTPHLNFAGQCREAFLLYERCFGGKIQTMLTYGESPMADQTPPEWRDKIVHATLTTGDGVLAGTDILPGQYQPPRGFYVIVDIADPAKAEQIFLALSEGGMVQMPLQESFWALRFGVVTDRFGIAWEVNCEKSR